jgi:hypothetical protein
MPEQRHMKTAAPSRYAEQQNDNVGNVLREMMINIIGGFQSGMQSQNMCCETDGSQTKRLKEMYLYAKQGLK